MGNTGMEFNLKGKEMNKKWKPWSEDGKFIRENERSREELLERDVYIQFRELRELRSRVEFYRELISMDNQNLERVFKVWKERKRNN